MRETGFIKQNKKKWLRLEQMLKAKKKDPDSLSKLFIQVTDDLSYSKTFYPNRAVKVYLNNIARAIFLNLYKNKKGRKNKFIEFWKMELPRVMYESRKELLISFLVFVLAVFIGVLSSANDPEFPRIILGDGYVEMTKENIKSGDPMKVYKSGNELDMFLYITINNVRVAFMTFVFGIFLAIGTLGVMIYNGIMVGSFQHFFYAHGYFKESFLTIWMHGTLEISAIIIAGCAGLVMGSGLVFPGTYSRAQAFQISARRGIMIMLGLTPVFIFAGFIEGFLTRYTELPDPARLGVIILSLSFIIGYFLVYPKMLANKGAFREPLKQAKLPKVDIGRTDYHTILTGGQIITMIFTFYRRYFKPILKTSLVSAILYSILVYSLAADNLEFMSTVNYFSPLQMMFQYINKLPGFFQYNEQPVLFILNTLLFSVMIFLVSCLISGDFKGLAVKELLSKKILLKSIIRIYPVSLFVSAVINCALFLNSGWVILALCLVIPINILFIVIWEIEKTNPLNAFKRTIQLIKGNWVKVYGLFLGLAALGFLYFFFIDSPILWFFLDVLQWNLALEESSFDILIRITLTGVTFLTMMLIIPVILIGIGLLYFSLKEMKEATYLKQKISQIGQKKHMHGLELED